jgi:hypothetical protein
MEPFDVAVAFWMMIRRPPMSDAEVIEDFDHPWRIRALQIRMPVKMISHHESIDTTKYERSIRMRFLIRSKVVSRNLGLTSMKNLIAKEYRGRNPKGYFRDLP